MNGAILPTTTNQAGNHSTTSAGQRLLASLWASWARVVVITPTASYYGAMRVSCRTVITHRLGGLVGGVAHLLGDSDEGEQGEGGQREEE